MALLVNGEYVDDSVIRAEANATRPRYEELIDELDPVAREIQLWDWSKETVVERVLLRQQALEDPDPVSEKEIEEAPGGQRPEAGGGLQPEVETRLRIDRLLRKITATVPPPKQRDVADYYRKYKEHFVLPDMVMVAHIIKLIDQETSEEAAVSSLKLAEAELKTGVPFERVAERYSDRPEDGGNLGYVARGQLVAELDNVIFHLRPQEISEIFRSPHGWHIVKCIDKRRAGVQSLGSVKQEIERLLHQEMKERALEVYVDGLKARAEIRTVPKRE